MIESRRFFAIAACFLFPAFTAEAQWTGDQRVSPEDKKEVTMGRITPMDRRDPAMTAFRNYGIGQFIHWGIYSIPGNEWNGRKARGVASEWIRVWNGPGAPENWAATYDHLYQQFDPKNFNPEQWAKQAKQMGARYLVFTTKHHDGFCLWPTKYSDYNISRTPFKQDIVGRVVDAYTAEGIDVFLYYSVIEWNHPDYMAKVPKTDAEKKRFGRFLDYTRNQLFELLERYPSAKGFWFDGTWDPSWVAVHEFTYQLEKDIRAKRPDFIIGSRFRNDEHGKRHFDSNGVLLGDYEQGWERKLPANFKMLNGNDWDCVMTIPPNGWGYMKDWSGIYTKNTDDILELLMRCRSMNGNFVLNFGPDGNGRMSPGEDRIARELGEWIKVNGEAVYEARHAGLPDTGLGYHTRKGDVLYLTVFNRPLSGVARIAIQKKADKVPRTASILGREGALEVKHSDIGFDLDANTYYDITLPVDFQATRAFVIKIVLGSPVSKAGDLMKAKQ